MSQKDWYSAKVRLVALVNPDGADLFMDSVYTFQATEWDEAFQRALELGRSQEGEYVNAEGQSVRWKLMKVINLNWLKVECLEGAEVHSEFVDVPVDERIPFDSQFAPENVQPSETL